jgi:diguanylate cyclase (GGDEF)-like protein
VILVIDDEPRNIEILAEILEESFEVVFATSGRRAFEVIAAGRPDLILLDVMMPEMDGYAVCKALKQAPATAAIPVIFVTGMNDVEAEARGLELGAVDYISKPLSPTVVRVRVRNQIDLTRARDALSRLALTDSLTGLSNRRNFDDTLKLEFQRLVRGGGWLSLIMLDVDHFKSFNDHYGHVAGDECLRRIATEIGGLVCRAADLPARYGGDEFASILPDTDLVGASQVATRLREGIEALGIRHAHSQTADHVTASLGVATVRCLAGRISLGLLACADEQLYSAKRAGRNQVRTSLLD